MHRTHHACANDNPRKARKVAPLRRKHRPDERSRAGNGGEMMPEEHRAMRRMIVNAIMEPVRGRHARIVEREHFCRNHARIEAIRHKKGRKGNKKEPC